MGALRVLALGPASRRMRPLSAPSTPQRERPVSTIVTLTLNPAIDQTVILDGLRPGSVHRARAVLRHAGGKGVNVACCLADWGWPWPPPAFSAPTTMPPSPTSSRRRASKTASSGYPGRPRTNLKLLDDRLGEPRTSTSRGSLWGAALDAVRTVLVSGAERGTLAVLAGSLPAGIPPETYAELTAHMNAKGVRVVLDASGPALAAALARPRVSAFAVKPNRHELEEWAGTRCRPSPTCGRPRRICAAADSPVVVVSLGEELALFISAEGAVQAHPPATRIKSTVGAGDALVAGLVAALRADHDLPATARLATAFAAAKLTREGASLPPRAEVEAVARTVRVATL